MTIEGSSGLLHTPHPSFVTSVTKDVAAPCEDGTHSWESIGAVHRSEFRCVKCTVEVRDLRVSVPKERLSA